MDKYVCTPCGYEYDPAVGDPDNDIAPGTPFEALPDDWVCPICGAAKSNFEKAGVLCLILWKWTKAPLQGMTL